MSQSTNNYESYTSDEDYPTAPPELRRAIAFVGADYGHMWNINIDGDSVTYSPAHPQENANDDEE